MTVRYRSLSEFQTPPRIEVTGTALEIFGSNSFVPGTYACPTDALGSIAQFNGTAWSGFLGVFNQTSQLTALPTTYMSSSCTAQVVISGVVYDYVLYGTQFVIKQSPGYRSLSNFWTNRWDPAYQVAPNILTNQYVNGSGVIGAFSGLNVSAHIPVVAGETIGWWNDQQENLADKGGFYNSSGTWLSSFGSNTLYSGQRVLFKVPANAVTARVNFRLSTHRYWFGSRLAEQKAKMFESLTFEGDSLFAGSGLYFDKTVPQRVGEFFGVSVENHAVGGRRITGTTTGLWNQVRSTNHLASAGVFMAGYNDWSNSVALGAVTSSDNLEFNGALNSTLSYLANGRPWQKWFVFTPPPTSTASPNTLGLTLRDYCQVIIDACLRYGITCIDLNAEWGIDYRQQYMNYLYSPDGIHENWLSTDLMAGYIYHKLLSGG